MEAGGAIPSTRYGSRAALEGASKQKLELDSVAFRFFSEEMLTSSVGLAKRAAAPATLISGAMEEDGPVLETEEHDC